MSKKCPNSELFLVQMKKNTDQKKIRIWTFFMVYAEPKISLFRSTCNRSMRETFQGQEYLYYLTVPYRKCTV